MVVDELDHALVTQVLQRLPQLVQPVVIMRKQPGEMGLMSVNVVQAELLADAPMVPD